MLLPPHIPRDKQLQIRITIEGYQGAGKTQIANWLQQIFPFVQIREIQTVPLPQPKDPA